MMSDESLHFTEIKKVWSLTQVVFLTWKGTLASFFNSEKRAEVGLSISSLVTVNHILNRELKYRKCGNGKEHWH